MSAGDHPVLTQRVSYIWAAGTRRLGFKSHSRTPDVAASSMLDKVSKISFFMNASAASFKSSSKNTIKYVIYLNMLQSFVINNSVHRSGAQIELYCFVYRPLFGYVIRRLLVCSHFGFCNPAANDAAAGRHLARELNLTVMSSENVVTGLSF